MMRLLRRLRLEDSCLVCLLGRYCLDEDSHCALICLDGDSCYTVLYPAFESRPRPPSERSRTPPADGHMISPPAAEALLSWLSFSELSLIWSKVKPTLCYVPI